MPKRRFGISVPSGLAARLDELARALEVDRSTLVTEVLQEFMHDRLHVLRPHPCKGVLVVVSGRGEAPRLADLYERYKEAIRARMHYHSEDACVDVLVVEAESGVLLRLERELRGLGAARTRYLPLAAGCREPGAAPR